MASEDSTSETPTEAVQRREVDRDINRLEARLATLRELASIQVDDIDPSDHERLLYHVVSQLARVEMVVELNLEQQEDHTRALIEANRLKLREIRTDRMRIAEREHNGQRFAVVARTVRGMLSSPRVSALLSVAFSSAMWSAAMWWQQCSPTK